MTKEAAFQRVLRNEGGSNIGTKEEALDPGGATMWGLPVMVWKYDPKTFTLAQALSIYNQIWQTQKMDNFGDELGEKLFDMSFPMGWNHAVRCLQGALNACDHPIKVDGIVGPDTMKAIDDTFSDELLSAFRSECAGHFRLRAELKPTTLGHLLPGLLRRAYER